MPRSRRGRRDQAPRHKQAASGRAAALEATAALLALAMQESHGAVQVLSAALERMHQALAHGAGPQLPARLEQELTVCVESLQFHDRLMQQLTQVRNCLAGLAESEPGGAKPGAARSWGELKRNLAERLISDSQRALLELLLPVAGGAGEPRAPREGSIELF
jgi:hypothetical protein